jgi:hypothetical protein
VGKKYDDGLQNIRTENGELMMVMTTTTTMMMMMMMMMMTILKRKIQY